ncbi:hypothetical protein P4S72_08650 [Vibrio sp. PP-XX7]
MQVRRVQASRASALTAAQRTFRNVSILDVLNKLNLYNKVILRLS